MTPSAPRISSGIPRSASTSSYSGRGGVTYARSPLRRPIVPVAAITRRRPRSSPRSEASTSSSSRRLILASVLRDASEQQGVRKQRRESSKPPRSHTSKPRSHLIAALAEQQSGALDTVTQQIKAKDGNACPRGIDDGSGNHEWLSCAATRAKARDAPATAAIDGGRRGRLAVGLGRGCRS